MAQFMGYPQFNQLDAVKPQPQEQKSIYDTVREAQDKRMYNQVNDIGETRVAPRQSGFQDPGMIGSLFDALTSVFRQNPVSQAAPRQNISPIATYNTFQKFTDDYGDPLYSKVEPLILELKDEQYYPQDDLMPSTYFLPVSRR